MFFKKNLIVSLRYFGVCCILVYDICSTLPLKDFHVFQDDWPPFQILGNEFKNFTEVTSIDLTITVQYPEFFWAYQYMYWNWDFNESVGERTIKQ